MTTTQFDPSEFDQWAERYDADALSGAGFPFDGYARVLDTVARAVGDDPRDVLDLGAGTGNLSARLAERGARLWCLDFSAKMLEIARRRLPDARFAHADLRGVWPPDFCRRFNNIVSGYTFHHFPLEEKIALVGRLLDESLLPGGRLVIGDIAFSDRAALDAARLAAGEDWEDEYYWLADETLPAVNARGWQAGWEQVSRCAGVFVIHK